jgi:hypothetical protein
MATAGATVKKRHSSPVPDPDQVARLHNARSRARMVTLVDRVVAVVRHATGGRPHRDLTALADTALAQAGALRLTAARPRPPRRARWRIGPWTSAA